MGQEGSFEEENEGIVGLELAGLTDEEMSELQALQSLSIVTPEDHPQYESIQIRLQELRGKLKAADGGYINRPGYKDAGLVTEALTDITGDASEWYDNFLEDEELTEEGLESLREKFDIQKMMEGMYDEEGNFIGDPGMMYDPSNPDGTITIPGPGGDMVNVLPMAQGGKVKRPGYFLGGLAALLGAGVLGSKIFGKKEATKAPPKPMIEKMPGPINFLPDDEEENQIGLQPLNRAQGGIADLDMRGGGHSIGPGTGTSDDVPAMLSDGEFVMTANAVRNLGGGNRMLGAQRMYNMMNSLDPNSQTPGEMNVAGYG
jgi:hypothetical protein